jgi:hypothetical protein
MKPMDFEKQTCKNADDLLRRSHKDSIYSRRIQSAKPKSTKCNEQEDQSIARDSMFDSNS